MKDNGLPYSLIHNDAIASCIYVSKVLFKVNNKSGDWNKSVSSLDPNRTIPRNYGTLSQLA